MLFLYFGFGGVVILLIILLFECNFINTLSVTGAYNMQCVQTHSWDLLSVHMFIKNIWDQPDLWQCINVTTGGLYACTLRRTSTEENNTSFKRISSRSLRPDLGAVFFSPSDNVQASTLCARFQKQHLGGGREASSAWTCLSLVIVRRVFVTVKQPQSQNQIQISPLLKSHTPLSSQSSQSCLPRSKVPC